jgi:hypothetical protein
MVCTYNLHITYPEQHQIMLCQIKHHLNMVDEFSCILAKYLFTHVGLPFGADFIPANCEVVHWVQSALAESLFSDTTLVHKHY